MFLKKSTLWVTFYYHNFLISSLICKHRNKRINVNSINTCNHITHLQSATLQSTFSATPSLRKHNYVEQLCRVMNQIQLTWTSLLHPKTTLNKLTLHMSVCSYKHFLVSSYWKVIHRKLTHTVHAQYWFWKKHFLAHKLKIKKDCVLCHHVLKHTLQNSNYTTFWKTVK